MSVNSRGFFILILVVLSFGFVLSRRLQPPSTAETFETLTPQRGGSTPAPIAPTQQAATYVPSAAIEGQAQTQVADEPEISAAPEISDIKKSVAAFTLQEFGKLAGMEFHAPFSLDHAEVSSLAGDVLKFNGTDEAGTQTYTVLMMKKRDASGLANAYQKDLDLQPNNIHADSSDGVITATVDDPEGAHIYAVSEIGQHTYLIARAQKQSFSANEVSELKSLLRAH